MEITTTGERHYQLRSFPRLWSTNNDGWNVDVDPRNVNSARFAYANAFEFEPRGFAAKGISSP